MYNGFNLQETIKHYAPEISEGNSWKDILGA